MSEQKKEALPQTNETQAFGMEGLMTLFKGLISQNPSIGDALGSMMNKEQQINAGFKVEYIDRSDRPALAIPVDILFATDEHIPENPNEIKNPSYNMLPDSSQAAIKKILSTIQVMASDEIEVLMFEIIKRYPKDVLRLILGQIIGVR